MKKNYFLCIVIFVFAISQQAFAQGSAKFNEYLKKKPSDEKSYKVV